MCKPRKCATNYFTLVDVAIDLASDDDEKDIISEMRVLQHVGAHPNVVGLLGASVHQGNSLNYFITLTI